MVSSSQRSIRNAVAYTDVEIANVFIENIFQLKHGIRSPATSHSSLRTGVWELYGGILSKQVLDVIYQIFEDYLDFAPKPFIHLLMKTNLANG